MVFGRISDSMEPLFDYVQEVRIPAPVAKKYSDEVLKRAACNLLMEAKRKGDSSRVLTLTEKDLLRVQHAQN
jgi:hypothetical protein